jgi:hypothetical protein
MNRVSGGIHEPDTDISRERLQRVSADLHSWELTQALMSAVAGDPHWRRDAQALLRRIAAGSLPEHLS